jgi:catechol 2,3-dioxygenase-like lactoylglutathione lyase family enzyme
MLNHFSGIDHVVLNVRDRMGEAAEQFRRRGFQLTPRGYHTLGSINHLMVFQRGYLEILGYIEGKPAPRTELVANPIGLIACALASSDSRAIYDELTAKGIPLRGEPGDFSRPVELADGQMADASFRVARLDRSAVEGPMLTFCQHFTPHLVWRREWQTHPNGVDDLFGGFAVVEDPAAALSNFENILGGDVVNRKDASVSLGYFMLKLVTAAALQDEFGDLAPDPQGRTSYMAALILQTKSLDMARNALRASGVSCREGTNSFTVPATAAMGAALRFITAEGAR